MTTYRRLAMRPLRDPKGVEETARWATRIAADLDEWFFPASTKGVPVEEPFALMICGPRGRGKTSALEVIKASLKESKSVGGQDKYLIVQFAVWYLLGDSKKREKTSDIVWQLIASEVRTRTEKMRSDSSRSRAAFDASSGQLEDHSKKMSGAAAAMSLGREEAAQAAMAFAYDAEDFPLQLAKGLSGLTAWTEFKDSLKQWLRESKTVLVVLVDDLDLFPQATVSVVRAVASLREAGPVGTVVAADSSRLAEQLAYDYEGHDRVHDNDDFGSDPAGRRTGGSWAIRSQKDLRSITWALAGEERELPAWSSTRQLQFLVEPFNELDGKGSPRAFSRERCDPRLLWAWYLMRWDDQTALSDDTPSLECLLQQYKDLVMQLALCDSRAGVATGSGTPSEYWAAWRKTLAPVGCAWDDVGFATALDIRSEDDCVLQSLLGRLWPVSPRQAVQFTNSLLAGYNAWMSGERPIEARLDWRRLSTRRARFLVWLAHNHFAPDAFARLLGDQAWPVIGGLKQGWLVPDPHKVLIFDQGKLDGLQEQTGPYVSGAALGLIRRVEIEAELFPEDAATKYEILRLLKLQHTSDTE